MAGVPKVFSRTTLGKFEDAAASIPLRNIARAFDRANISLGEDPGGPEGARRTNFRRYVAGVDQRVPQQLDRLGDAFGALLAEVAASKIEFLVQAAQSDGFSFADGVFRTADTTATSFAVTRVEDSAFIAECGRRLRLLANDRASDAIDGAKELIETLCRTVLRLLGEPLPKGTVALGDIAKTTLDALSRSSIGSGDANAAITEKCFQHLGDFATILSEMPIEGSALQARFAAGGAVTFATFVAETYVENNFSGSPPARRTAK